MSLKIKIDQKVENNLKKVFHSLYNAIITIVISFTYVTFIGKRGLESAALFEINGKSYRLLYPIIVLLLLASFLVVISQIILLRSRVKS